MAYSWGVRIAASTAITAAIVSPAPDTSRTLVRIGFDMDGRLLFAAGSCPVRCA
jgi:hypothetical protein